MDPVAFFVQRYGLSEAAARQLLGVTPEPHQRAGFKTAEDYRLYLQSIRELEPRGPAPEPFRLENGGAQAASLGNTSMNPMAQRMALIRATREGRLEEADDILTQNAVRRQNEERERKLFRANDKKTRKPEYQTAGIIQPAPKGY